MERLPTNFRSDGFEFEQLAREDDIALFRKTKPGLSFETFEVVIIRKYDEHLGPQGRLIKAGECMPSSSRWGEEGWSLQTRERAWEKFRELV